MSQLLLDVNLRISDLNYTTDEYGNTALLSAILFVDKDLTTYYVRQLIEAGADTDCLKNICISDDLELAKFLMKEGIEFNPLSATPDESYSVVGCYQPYAYEKPYQMPDMQNKHQVVQLIQQAQNFTKTSDGRDGIVKAFEEDKNYTKLVPPIQIISKNYSKLDSKEPSSSSEGFSWEPSSDLESFIRKILSDYDEPQNDEENVELCTSIDIDIDLKELIGSDLDSALA